MPEEDVTEPESSQAAVPDLHAIIWERYIKALDIERRLHVIDAYVAELQRVSRGKPFRIRNEIVWNAMLDVRDKLTIDLFSLTVEMRHGMKPLDPKVAERTWRGSLKKKRGMFVELRDHHCASLTRTYVPHADDDEYEIAMHTKGKAELFARVFPKCATESPTPADIDQLCEDFRIRMVPLGEDRNKNRAHAFEGDIGKAKLLSPSEHEALFDYIKELLENLSLLSSGSAFADGGRDCSETAADLVDQVLLGQISDVRRFTTRRTREQLYERLHKVDTSERRHEDEFTRRELHFNDRMFGPPFYTTKPRAAKGRSLRRR